MKGDRRPGAAQQLRKWTVLALLFAGLGVLGYTLDRMQPRNESVQSPTRTAAATAAQAKISARIEGSVARPGVYAMREGDRVKDLVDKAGGLPEGYEVGRIEVSMFSVLFDGQLVVIP